MELRTLRESFVYYTSCVPLPKRVGELLYSPFEYNFLLNVKEQPSNLMKWLNGYFITLNRRGMGAYYGCPFFSQIFYDSFYVFLMDKKQVCILNDTNIIFGILIYYDTMHIICRY